MEERGHKRSGLEQSLVERELCIRECCFSYILEKRATLNSAVFNLVFFFT